MFIRYSHDLFMEPDPTFACYRKSIDKFMLNLFLPYMDPVAWEKRSIYIFNIAVFHWILVSWPIQIIIYDNLFDPNRHYYTFTNCIQLRIGLQWCQMMMY